MSTLKDFLALLTNATKLLNLNDELHQKITQPNYIFSTKINLTKDDGSIQELNAYRVQHNNTRGLTREGFAFTLM